jgi:hypothetical protein
MSRTRITARFLLTTSTLIICTALWCHGMLNSVILNPELLEQRNRVTSYGDKNRADTEAERALAEGYWLRYPDIRQDPAYGENGTMGIFGPRTHFEQHGKHENRIFAPVTIPDDPVRERELAETYWKRYPEIEKNVIWGRKSGLGILGPRDHYLFIGKEAGWKWGAGGGDAPQTP